MATFYKENRVSVQLDEVAPVMRKALLAIEDSRFYEHGALDLEGHPAGFLVNEANDGVVQGGSTITQQLVKATLVAQARNPRSARRGHRALLRPQAARASLRRRPGGEPQQGLDPGALPEHGLLRRTAPTAIEAAAEHYFDTRPPSSDLGQAALLAGLVQEPDRLRPDARPRSAALLRREASSPRMAELGVIGDAAREGRRGTAASGSTSRSDRNGCLASRAALVLRLRGTIPARTTRPRRHPRRSAARAC